MNPSAQQNMELVNSLMRQAATEKGQTIQQGNKALIPVSIDYEADSGKYYEGTLFFRRPSAMDYIRMGAIKSELLRSFGIRPIIEYVQTPDGGSERMESMTHVDASVKFLAHAIATCDVLLASPVPEWFQHHRDMEDADVVIEAYRNFDVALASFRSGTQGVPSRNSQARYDEENVADSQAVREREPQGDGRDTSAE